MSLLWEGNEKARVPAVLSGPRLVLLLIVLWLLLFSGCRGVESILAPSTPTDPNAPSTCMTWGGSTEVESVIVTCGHHR